jgi:hypothetical protein
MIIAFVVAIVDIAKAIESRRKIFLLFLDYPLLVRSAMLPGRFIERNTQQASPPLSSRSSGKQCLWWEVHEFCLQWAVRGRQIHSCHHLESPNWTLIRRNIVSTARRDLEPYATTVGRHKMRQNHKATRVIWTQVTTSETIGNQHRTCVLLSFNNNTPGAYSIQSRLFHVGAWQMLLRHCTGFDDRKRSASGCCYKTHRSIAPFHT